MNNYIKLKLAFFQLQEFIKRETKDNKTCYLTEKDIKDLVGFEIRIGEDLSSADIFTLFQRARYSDEFNVQFIESCTRARYPDEFDVKFIGKRTSGSGIVCPDQLKINRIKEVETPKPVIQSENTTNPEPNKNNKKVKIKLNGFFESRRYEESECGFSNDFILVDYKAFDFKDYMCEVDESSIRSGFSFNSCVYKSHCGCRAQFELNIRGNKKYSSIEILPDDTEIDLTKCPLDYLVSLPYPLKVINT